MGTGGTVVVTFDLFSALIDSRRGAGAVLDRLAAARAWEVSGTQLYDDWDARNKQAQRACEHWVPYVELAGGALAETYAARGLCGDPAADVAHLLETLPDWPLWPDVEEGLPELARHHRIGLLSNVDDELFRRTRAAALVDADLAMTSQRLAAYKPDRRIYHRARDAFGRMVHVATSARDVRGALEAGIPVVRLRRPGHDLDPRGPRPELEAEGVAELDGLVARAVRSSADG